MYAVGLTVNRTRYDVLIDWAIDAGVWGKCCDQGQSDIKLMISKGKSKMEECVWRYQSSSQFEV